MKFTKATLAQITAVLLCSTMLFCGCTKDSDVVIKVNDQNITRGEYFEDFNKIKNVQFKNSPKELKKDTSYAVLSLKEKYTNDVVMRAILSQEFNKRNITATEDEIQAKQKQIIAQIGSEEQFKNILKENNVTNERLHKDMEQEVKMDKLVNSLGISDATDAEAQAFYNKNKAQFNMPERAMVSHILIETNPEAIKRKIADADKSAKLSTTDIEKKVKEEVERKEALAKEVSQKALKNPKDFAKLAQEYSDDEASAKNGGDLGFVTRTTVVKEFADAAFSQKIGVVGPLVKTQFGYHIILVKDRAPQGMQSFAQVKNDLKMYLTQMKKMEIVQKYITDLKNNAKVEYVDESLNPKTIKKQLDDALKEQIELQQKAKTPKSKQKVLNKMEK
ncbi:MAG: peptidylprolyl isomerase [Candidatus Gastranaerophilales bacterium]|nr:peptidylprolyl isomerase [Candidatus Gastranaerophilales bacterium]